jgi:hypothetical protein
MKLRWQASIESQTPSARRSRATRLRTVPSLRVATGRLAGGDELLTHRLAVLLVSRSKSTCARAGRDAILSGPFLPRGAFGSAWHAEVQ